MKRILACFIILVLFTGTNAALASNAPPVVAEGALLIDSTTGKILFEKNKDTKFYPASITKIMTALLVLENCELDDKVIIGEHPPFVEGSKIYVIEDEEFTVEQLLYALLIESANDVASAFAEHISGSEEAFARLMTERAKELGCTNTNFANPHGLYSPDHYTTAYDMYLIAKEAIKSDAYRKIVTARTYTMEPTNKQPEKRYFHSNNRLMFNSRYRVEGANGAKTGYTSESGHSVVATAFRDDTNLMVVLLKDKKPGLWEDARDLLNYGFERFKTTKEVSAGNYITSLKVANTDIELPLVADNDLYYTRQINDDEEIDSEIEIFNTYSGYILKGQTLGRVEYRSKGSKVGSVNLVADADLPATALFKYTNDEGSLKKQYSPWLLLPAVVFILLSLITSIRIMKKKKSSV